VLENKNTCKTAKPSHRPPQKGSRKVFGSGGARTREPAVFPSPSQTQRPSCPDAGCTVAARRRARGGTITRSLHRPSSRGARRLAFSRSMWERSRQSSYQGEPGVREGLELERWDLPSAAGGGRDALGLRSGLLLLGFALGVAGGLRISPATRICRSPLTLEARRSRTSSAVLAWPAGEAAARLSVSWGSPWLHRLHRVHDGDRMCRVRSWFERRPTKSSSARSPAAAPIAACARSRLDARRPANSPRHPCPAVSETPDGMRLVACDLEGHPEHTKEVIRCKNSFSGSVPSR
jgi:hypothetical protein